MAIVVSSTSIKLASATRMAISQGLTPVPPAAAGASVSITAALISTSLNFSISDDVVSTRTVGTTDMPGPSATSVGGSSMTILTGTRWTILT